ncbi:MAG: hypothetical protein JJ895_09180 [Balneolaceae bacterium]|nr:hypothetical protein [Balneolaceae bacterium]
MQKVSQNDIEWLLQKKEQFNPNTLSSPSSISSKPSTKQKRRSIGYYLTGFLFMAVSLVILPFFILIRTAVHLNISEQWNAWGALLGGTGVCILFLSLLFFFVFRKVKNKKLMAKLCVSSISMLVGGFIIYGLLYLNSVNAKSDEIRDVYRSLHPILRVAVTSTTLADNELVITDISRTQDDYIAMGLTPLQSSMHYEQETGFVHAIDLRTIGHSEIRNVSLEWGLNLLGFKTIRHVGTADHLHVALPLSN